MQAEPGMILVSQHICCSLAQRVRIRWGENLVFSDRKPARFYRTIALTRTNHENSRSWDHLTGCFEKIVCSPEICVECILEILKRLRWRGLRSEEHTDELQSPMYLV